MIKSTTINRASLAWLFEQPIDVQIETLQNHFCICRIIINQLFEEELRKKAGPRYKHDSEQDQYPYSRYGYNPGSVRIGKSKLKVDVPRLLRGEDKKLESPEYYRLMHQANPIDEDQLSKGILLGLSMRDYGKVIDSLGESFGLSKSSLSRQFIEDTSKKLEAFEKRKFNEQRFVAIFIDGKHIAGQQMVIALGITEQGDKVPLAAIQTATENSKVIAQMLRNLIERGLYYQDGILFIIDGSTGLKKALEEVFGDYAVIQRCIWHKRENILSYLPEKYHDEIKKSYHQALEQSTYELAKKEFNKLYQKLHTLNRSAAASLEEGLEELLTLHKLELKEDFSKSFSTTNCIESLNSQIARHIHKVTYWETSDERYRWVVAALLIAENRMKKVGNYKKLYMMKTAIKKEVEKKISQSLGHGQEIEKSFAKKSTSIFAPMNL